MTKTTWRLSALMGTTHFYGLSGECCHETAAERFCCTVSTATHRAVTSMAGSGIVFRDGRIESGGFAGNAGHVLDSDTHRRVATLTPARCFALSETCHGPNFGSPMCLPLSTTQQRLDSVRHESRTRSSARAGRPSGLRPSRQSLQPRGMRKIACRSCGQTCFQPALLRRRVEASRCPWSPARAIEGSPGESASIADANQPGTININGVFRVIPRLEAFQMLEMACGANNAKWELPRSKGRLRVLGSA